MTASTSGVNSTSGTPASTASTSTTPTAANTQTVAGTIGSMADLKNESPQVYNAMMQGIAMNICNEMDRHQKELKRIQQEARRDAQG